MKGLDLSFSLGDLEWWERRYAEGYRVMVQDLWTGGSSSEGFRETAPVNIHNARLAGLRVCGYTNVAPWNTGRTAFEKAQEFAGDQWDHLEVVFVDVEIAAWKGQGIREADVRACLELVEEAGKKTAVYTAHWFWTGHMGNAQWPWLGGYGLWNAHYDGDPDFDFGRRPYGPWTDVIGEQYKGTTDIEGVVVDLNEFRDEYFTGSDLDTAPIEPGREENDVRYIRIKGQREVYAVVGGQLSHAVSGAVMVGQAGESWTDQVEELDLDNANSRKRKINRELVALPVQFSGGIPARLGGLSETS